MKTILLIITILLSNLLFAQRSNTIFSTSENGLAYFEYKDFIENNISSVEAYSFKINKRGKVKRDSTRLYVQVLNTEQKRISGINCNLVFQSHGPTYFTWYKFKKYYNDEGLLVLNIEEPVSIEKRKEFGFIEYDINKSETSFQYNQKGQLIKETTTAIEDSYSIYRSDKDTSHHRSIHPKSYEYIYDEIGREIERYHTDDSTRYLKTKTYTPDSNSVHCFYCDPRHLNDDRKYGANKKLNQWTWYTDEGDIHSKKYYYYNNQDKLIKRVDSTGWYLMKHSNEYPILQKTIQYEYRDSFLWKTIKKDDSWERETEYNQFGDIVKECSKYKTEEPNCTNYKYEYQDKRLIKMTRISPKGNKFQIVNFYNNKGLIIMERQYKNDKLISLVKYKYWIKKEY